MDTTSDAPRERDLGCNRAKPVNEASRRICEREKNGEHEKKLRAAVVAEARSWLGTPYHNCADIKGVGVDCGMLLVRVFCALKLAPDFDPRPYASDWHLHRSEERYLGFVTAHLGEIEATDAQPADIVVFRYGRCYSHGGIITRRDPLAIVHAYYPNGCVTEDEVRRDANLAKPERQPQFFSKWLSGGSAPWPE